MKRSKQRGIENDGGCLFDVFLCGYVAQTTEEMEETMKRDLKNALIGGVCAGIAERFQIEVWIVRLAFFLAFWFGFSGLLVYVVLWIILATKE